ncbi:hypothetical protein J6590_105090, partial [Homalodisca vitripennis]
LLLLGSEVAEESKTTQFISSTRLYVNSMQQDVKDTVFTKSARDAPAFIPRKPSDLPFEFKKLK